jgi:hypothetical protein
VSDWIERLMIPVVIVMGCALGALLVYGMSLQHGGAGG